MPVTRHGDLSMTVVRDGDAWVSLSGTLAPGSVRFVRDALVELLRDVDRVLVDVANLGIARTSVLRVFPDALDAAGGWPAVRLGVVYRGRAMGQALRASGVARRVAIADEPDLALLRCAEQPGEVRARWQLPAGLDAPRRSRALLRLRMANWSCPGLDATGVETVLSELVTNAVLHAGTRVDVVLVLDQDGLRIDVRDFNPQHLPRVDPTAAVGLGLRIVAALASRWGVEPREGGKTVWARFGGDGHTGTLRFD